jgi:predicted nucleic acid-binding protein
MKKYADLPADFADASIVALCERRGIDTVATLDRHFDVHRTSARKQLQNVFTSRRLGE